MFIKKICSQIKKGKMSTIRNHSEIFYAIKNTIESKECVMLKISWRIIFVFKDYLFFQKWECYINTYGVSSLVSKLIVFNSRGKFLWFFKMRRRLKCVVAFRSLYECELHSTKIIFKHIGWTYMAELNSISKQAHYRFVNFGCKFHFLFSFLWCHFYQ